MQLVMKTALLLFLSFFVLSVTVGKNGGLLVDDPARCLHDYPKFLNTSCSSRAYDVECLIAPIKPFRHSIKTIHHCFSCCMSFWSQASNFEKLSKNVLNNWHSMLLNENNIPNWLKHIHNLQMNRPTLPLNSVVTKNLSETDFLLSIKKPLPLKYADEEIEVDCFSLLKFYNITPPLGPGILSPDHYKVWQLKRCEIHMECFEMRKKYDIIPGQSWGNLPQNLWPEWRKRGCDNYNLHDHAKFFEVVQKQTEGIRSAFDDYLKTRIDFGEKLHKTVLVSCFFDSESLASASGISSIAGLSNCTDSYRASITDYSEVISASKFVLFSTYYMNSKTVFLPRWALECLTLNSIPIIQVENMSSLYELSPPNIEYLPSWTSRLPIVFVSNASSLNFSILNNVYSQLVNREETFDISYLFLPRWFQATVPLVDIGSHSGNQVTMHSSITKQLKLNSLFQNFHIDPAIAQVYPKPGDAKFKIEVVVPRCCETFSSELFWIKLLYEGIEANFPKVLRDGVSLSFRIYYKCPFCIPVTQKHWFATVENDELLMQQVTQAGGIRMVDGAPEYCSEHPSFDRLENGKETTAYLNHIVSNFDYLADMMLFVHAKPAEHMFNFGEDELVLRLFRYLYATRSPVDFMSINYRYFQASDVGWSHAPMCIAEFLGYMFDDSDIANDANRHFSNNSTLFWKTAMSSYAAAQFFVSKKAILQRPLKWWQKLNNISSSLPVFSKCRGQLSWKSGSMFTQILERVWHTFFRDLNSSSPLQTPPRSTDESLPPYLRIDLLKICC